MLDNKGWINMHNTLNQKLFHKYSKNENLIELERERRLFYASTFTSRPQNTTAKLLRGLLF